ncbi:MAG: hypothetical protein ACR2NN_01270 [Bryobacteraceae bacterium]
MSNFPQYGYSYRRERGVSGFDQPRRFVLSALWELPFGKGRAMLNHGGILDGMFGGWQTNAIVTLADGTPFGIWLPVRRSRSDWQSFQWRTRKCYGKPTTFRIQSDVHATVRQVRVRYTRAGNTGQLGRNTLRSTGQRAVDFSMFKIFKVAERARLQLRGEALNALSSHFYNWRTPNANPTQANFGSLLPVGGDHGDLFNPRIIQLALKVIF